MRWIALGVVIVLAACSGDDHDVIVDGAVIVPPEVSNVIPPGDVIARNGYPDFDGDGIDDFILSYGPPDKYVNTQIGVLVELDGAVTRFRRPYDSDLTYEVDDVTGEGIADLVVTWWQAALTCRYSFQGGAWVAIDGVDLCQEAATDA